MPANQRYTTIPELLDKGGIVRTTELVKLMGISSETIRKDPEYPGNPLVQSTQGTLSLWIPERFDAGQKFRYYYRCLTNNMDKRITERRNTMSASGILGLMMVGPSNSHTAGAAKISGTTLAPLGALAVRTGIFLHGSFAKTYKGHGTDKVPIIGIMGMATNNSRIHRASELTGGQGLEVNIATGGIDGAHPNTVRVTLTDTASSTVPLLGSSTGGGNILVKEVNGMKVSIIGQHTTLIVLYRDTPDIITAVTEVIADTRVNICNFRLFRRSRGGETVIIIEIGGSFGPELSKETKVLPNIFSNTTLQSI